VSNATAKSKSSAPVATAKGHRPAGLFTWVAVGLVLVVVAVLVVVKVTSKAPTSSASSFQASSPTVVNELTHVPAAVFNAVGVTSSATPVSPIVIVKHAALRTVDGKPNVLYVGGEFCPYCAAERWSMIIALSRFGTFSNLGNTESYVGDVYGGTQTFTFVKSHYDSKYLSFSPVEEYTNTIDPKTNYYYPLMTASAAETADFMKYDTPTYVPGMTTETEHAYPYVSYGDQFLVAGAQYNPGLLSGSSRSQIAGNLASASSPITQAIIAAANYQTAGLCSLTKQQPMAVCASPGVKAADKKLGL
jgi:thiol-disulfide isomerase/thioredoxin